MTFGEQLNAYITRLGCTAKELSNASGLSPSVISRYRSGSRTPEADTENLAHIIDGIVHLAKKKASRSSPRNPLPWRWKRPWPSPPFPMRRCKKI